MPRSFVRRISDRYIAGTTIADAVRVVRELNAEGKMATVDVLGEEATSRRETQDIVRAYHDVFEAIERERLDSNVSIKLTALGLNLAYELCRANLFKVVRHAAESGNFVRIDMEDSTTTSDTIELYRELRAEGHENIGLVLQAALRRSVRDIHDLAPLQPNVRLVKGIYIEPPLIAYAEYEEVRENFVRCLHELLQAGSYTAIATHDEHLLTEGKRLVAERRAGARAVRVPDAARSARAGGEPARAGRASAAHLRPVRRALVPLLAPPPAGEPEDRRLRRLGHRESAVRRRRPLSYRRFFLIRLAQALFAVWLVATLVFVMFFVLLPKPARNLAGGRQATPSMIERVSDELHLDAPLHEQYAWYMWRLFAHQTAGRLACVRKSQRTGEENHSRIRERSRARRFLRRSPS